MIDVAALHEWAIKNQEDPYDGGEDWWEESTPAVIAALGDDMAEAEEYAKTCDDIMIELLGSYVDDFTEKYGAKADKLVAILNERADEIIRRSFEKKNS